MEDLISPIILCNQTNNRIIRDYPNIYKYKFREDNESFQTEFLAPIRNYKKVLLETFISYGILPYGDEHDKSFHYFYNLNLLAYKNNIDFAVRSDKSDIFIRTKSTEDAVFLKLIC